MTSYQSARLCESDLTEEPKERDYSGICCCCCCPPSLSFLVVNIVNMLLFGHGCWLMLPSDSLPYSLWESFAALHLYFAAIAVLFVWIYCSLQAIRHKKLIYIQVVWSWNLFLPVLVVLQLIMMFYRFLQLDKSITSSWARNRVMDDWSHAQGRAFIGVTWTIWTLFISDQYYAYLRDHQLWRERKAAEQQRIEKIETAPMMMSHKK